jgi:hypothetical protein
VPLVFAAAGPAEIVQDGVDGLHWTTLAQLAELTETLAGDPARTAELSRAAVDRAGDFSAVAFAEQLTAFLASDVAARTPT